MIYIVSVIIVTVRVLNYSQSWLDVVIVQYYFCVHMHSWLVERPTGIAVILPRTPEYSHSGVYFKQLSFHFFSTFYILEDTIDSMRRQSVCGARWWRCERVHIFSHDVSNMEAAVTRSETYITYIPTHQNVTAWVRVCPLLTRDQQAATSLIVETLVALSHSAPS